MEAPAKRKKGIAGGKSAKPKGAGNSAPLEESRNRPQYLDRVLVSLESHLFFLKTENIDWVEAEGNYVRLHCGPKSYLLRRTISQLAHRLDHQRHLRIHRSAIVNLDRIRELHPLSHGKLTVILHDGTELVWSLSYKNTLKDF